MAMHDDDLQEILTIFKGESEEHLQKLSEGILALEREPGKLEIIEEIFREAHSLKGAARMIGFEEIEKIAHRIEDIFNQARKGELLLSGKVSDFVLEGLDLINGIVALKLRGKGAGEVPVGDYLQRAPETAGAVSMPVSRVTAAAAPAPHPHVAEPAVPAKPPATPPPEPLLEDGINVSLGVREEISRGIQRVEEKIKIRKRQAEVAEVAPQYEETIRVSVDKLDELMAQVGEILVSKIRSDQRLTEAREFLDHLARFQKEWHRSLRSDRSRTPRPEERPHSRPLFWQDASRIIDDLLEQAQRLADGLAEENLRLELLSGNIQESVNRIRMLPLSAIFNFFPRLVRDIAREQGKEVDLHIRGGETRLDKRILEELKDPLTHLLRNSIDHGLESPEVRQAAGKPPAGRLNLTASQKGNNVLVELEDDGQGIDPQKIREVALKREFISPEALHEMTTSQLIQIIFQPGFTTKNIITDVSGRGVGLDVVLTNIEKLKGKISTNSSLGRGTRFSITLPLTLATTQALLIRTSGQRFAIPLTAVEFTGEVELEEVSTVEGKETVLISGQPVSLIRLSEVLELPEHPGGSEEQGKIPLVVLSSIEDRVAFVVDEFIGEKEVVVKHLGSHLVRVPNVAGATLLADGTPVMILNVFDLIKNARKARGLWVMEKRRARELAQTRYTILVVDDSITTRTLEKNILESSGYLVVTAVDGAEAMEKIKTRKVDLVVTDVQMPRMDGFVLTASLKKDKNYQQLPIILVTSLESEEDKRRGIEVGADAYITKGAFDQGNLLNTIRQLI